MIKETPAILQKGIQQDLYFIVAYNERLDWHARFCVTHISERAAKDYVQDDLGDEWEIKAAIRVCSTTDNVNMEV